MHSQIGMLQHLLDMTEAARAPLEVRQRFCILRLLSRSNWANVELLFCLDPTFTEIEFRQAAQGASFGRCLRGAHPPPHPAGNV